MKYEYCDGDGQVCIEMWLFALSKYVQATCQRCSTQHRWNMPLVALVHDTAAHLLACISHLECLGSPPCRLLHIAFAPCWCQQSTWWRYLGPAAAIIQYNMAHDVFEWEAHQGGDQASNIAFVKAEMSPAFMVLNLQCDPAAASFRTPAALHMRGACETQVWRVALTYLDFCMRQLAELLAYTNSSRSRRRHPVGNAQRGCMQRLRVRGTLNQAHSTSHCACRHLLLRCKKSSAGQYHALQQAGQSESVVQSACQFSA